jgi:hypothetical protein
MHSPGSRPSAFTDETLTSELFTRYGRATHRAAVLEMSQIVAVTFLETLSSRHSSPELFEERYAANLGHPPGIILQRLRPFILDRPDLTRHLEASLTERSRLAQGFFIDNIHDFGERSTRETMLDQLAAALTVFDEAESRLGDYLADYLEQSGMAPDSRISTIRPARATATTSTVVGEQYA